MCGLIGFSGSEEFDPQKIQLLILANMTRGVHATGIYNKGEITKEAVDAIEFLSKNKIEPSNLFIGHDRAATVGNKANSKNAHPFKYNSTIGVHNGTLKNHWDLARDAGKTYKDFDVDSQILVYLLSIQDNFEVLREFDGAAAVIWHDEEIKDRLYVFRNSERPLFRGMSEEGMYISSIEDSLKIIGCNNIQSFKTEYLYVIENGEINVKESKKLSKKKAKKKYSHNTSNVVKSSGTDYSIDKRCNWVKRHSSLINPDFTNEKYYKVVNEVGEYFIVINNKNERIRSLKTNFTEIEDLNLNNYVIAPKGSKGTIKDGELLFLRGLENKEGVTYAVLEKIEDKENVYTWPKHNIRNAELNEIQDVLKKAQKNDEGEEKRFKEAIDQEFSDYVENTDFMDKDGNRLGLNWIEIGALYEDAVSLNNFIDEIQDAVNDIISLYNTASPIDDELLNLSISIDDLVKQGEEIAKDIVEKSMELS